MGKGILLAVFAILLSASLVSALTPQDAMMKALKTGNYSIAEPYLSPVMKKAFSENAFVTLRNGLINAHGEINGYQLIKTEEKGGYKVYYYRVIAERGNYTVSVTVKNGEVEGFHLKSLPIAFNTTALYPMAGVLLAFLLLWLYVRKLGAAGLIFGIVLLVIILIIQPPVQALPRFAGVSNIPITVIWTGFVAGLFQETIKYFASRDKSLRKALYIGAGFGLGEGFYVAALSMLPILGTPTAAAISALERFLALLFHSSTTVLFAHAYKKGWGRKALLTMILVHWFIDSLAAYWHYNPSYTILAVSYTLMALPALLLFRLLPLARAESGEPVVRW